MAVIKIDTFGGEVPSASSRSIPPGAARRAFNLLARVNEFRPLNKDIVKTTKAIEVAAGRAFSEDGKTLYRFSINGDGNPHINDTLGWVSAPDALTYVKGQINDSLTERVYISTMDGTAAPIVIDATGVQKPLGVPSPAAAPAVVHNVVNEYSSAEAEAAKASITLAMMDAFKASRSSISIGDAPAGAPTTSVPGWLPHGTTGITGTLPTTEAGDWAFCIPMTSGVLDFPSANYLMGTEFGGVAITYITKTFWAVPATMQGIGYTINEASLGAALKAVQNPDPGAILPTVQAGFTNVGQLVPDSGVDAAVANIVSTFSQTETPQSASITELSIARVAFEKSISDYSNNTAMAAQVTAFYTKDPGNGVTPESEITQAIANFAAAIVAAENGILFPPTYQSTGV